MYLHAIFVMVLLCHSSECGRVACNTLLCFGVSTCNFLFGCEQRHLHDSLHLTFPEFFRSLGAGTTDGAVSGAVSGNRVLSQALRALKRSHSGGDDTNSERRRAEALLEVPKGIFMDIFSSSSGNALMTSLDESPQGPLLDTESIVLPPPPTVGLQMVRSRCCLGVTQIHVEK